MLDFNLKNSSSKDRILIWIVGLEFLLHTIHRILEGVIYQTI